MGNKDLNILTDGILNNFILNSPPSTMESYQINTNIPGLPVNINIPDLETYCQNDKCKERGSTQYKCAQSYLFFDERKMMYMEYEYTCKNCTVNKLRFFLGALIPKNSTVVNLIKIGEWPPLAHITPTKLLSIFGDKKDFYLKGKKCEREGLGIGAFVYYRRIVEETKNELFDLIISALKETNTEEQVISEFTKAKEQKSFERSVEKVKSIFPQELKIEGQNPLTLLHKALSIGVHKMSDKECLYKAKHIRIILFEFINRLNLVSEEKAELKEAIKKLSTK